MNDRAWVRTLYFFTPPLGCCALYGLLDCKRRDSALGSLEGKGWVVALPEFKDNLGVISLVSPRLLSLASTACEPHRAPALKHLPSPTTTG